MHTRLYIDIETREVKTLVAWRLCSVREGWSLDGALYHGILVEII